GRIDGFGMSLAVTVGAPAVWSVTRKVWWPADNAALTGSTALVSEEVMPTVSLVLTRFQLASTALTVTVKAVPAVWAVGVPLLPVELPGTGASPGARICSLVNVPTLTVIVGLVLALLLPSSTSVPVNVCLPPHFTLPL